MSAGLFSQQHLRPLFLLPFPAPSRPETVCVPFVPFSCFASPFPAAAPFPAGSLFIMPEFRVSVGRRVSRCEVARLVGARGREHDHDLRARPEQGRARGDQSAGQVLGGRRPGVRGLGGVARRLTRGGAGTEFGCGAGVNGYNCGRDRRRNRPEPRRAGTPPNYKFGGVGVARRTAGRTHLESPMRARGSALTRSLRRTR